MSVKDRVNAMNKLSKYEGGDITVFYLDSEGYKNIQGRFVRFDPYVSVSVDDQSIPFVGFGKAIHRIKIGRMIVYENDHAKDFEQCFKNPSGTDEHYNVLRQRTFGEHGKLKELFDEESLLYR